MIRNRTRGIKAVNDLVLRDKVIAILAAAGMTETAWTETDGLGGTGSMRRALP